MILIGSSMCLGSFASGAGLIIFFGIACAAGTHFAQKVGFQSSHYYLIIAAHRQLDPFQSIGLMTRGIILRSPIKHDMI